MEFITQLLQSLHRASTQISQLIADDHLQPMTANRSTFLLEKLTLLRTHLANIFKFLKQKLPLLGIHWTNIFQHMKIKLPQLFSQLKTKISSHVSSEQLKIAGKCLLIVLLLPFVFKVIVVSLSAVGWTIFSVLKVIIIVIKNVVVMAFKAIFTAFHFTIKVMKFVFSGGKMMIAPGTKGAVMISRATFEAAPKLYFQALRAGNVGAGGVGKGRLLFFGAIGVGVVCFVVKKFMGKE